MKQIIYAVGWLLLVIIGCKEGTNGNSIQEKKLHNISFQSGYELVNGLSMYYEIYGKGDPLVLIHGGGSTIQTSFEKIIPTLASNRRLIAVELQAHGRTSDRDADLSFEQDADDVVTLLLSLGIEKADFLGFSNGATTALHIAIRYPQLVHKIILASPLAKRNGVPAWFWEMMKNASLDNMPEQLKTAYKQVAPDSNKLQIMHDRDVKRMLQFKDIPDEQIQSVQAPTLIIIGDKDVITVEHATELSQKLADAALALIPGVHGEYFGEITTLTPDFNEEELVAPVLIEKFLRKKTDTH